MQTHPLVCLARWTGLLAPLLLAGCSQPDEIGKTIPVSGKVTLDGKEIPAGRVTFTPDEAKGNKAKGVASGDINGGTYTVSATTATQTRPGAAPGWYKVSVQSGMPPGGDVQAPPKGGMAKPATPAAAVAIPPAYTSPQTTRLEVEVKEGAPPGSYDLKLKH